MELLDERATDFDRFIRIVMVMMVVKWLADR